MNKGASLDRFCLQGKVALVSGGSHEIGRNIVFCLAEAGADVVLAARKLPDLEEVAREITTNRWGRSIAYHFSVKPKQCILPDT